MIMDRSLKIASPLETESQLERTA